MELKPIRLGKSFELRYIPFSELAVPWNVCLDSSKPRQDGSEIKQPDVRTHGAAAGKNSRALKTLKRDDLEALKHSIGRFGLLKPFEVAELPERLDFFYGGKGKYVIIDGQRRYFAIRELLRLPTEQDEIRQRDGLRTNSGHAQVEKAEAQAQEQFDRVSVRDFVLVPCLVYPYKTFLQMLRHSNEDKRFSVKPSKDSLELAEKMREQGIEDLSPEDLSEVWNTRGKIEEERQAIENTLQEIREKIKKGRVGEDGTTSAVTTDTLGAAEESRQPSA